MVTAEFAVLNFIQEHLRSGIMDFLMVVITRIGNYGIFWISLGLLLTAQKKYRRTGITVLAALGTEYLLCEHLLKPLVGRIRPCDINTGVQLLIGNPHEYSFPSGHAASSFAAATVLYRRGFRWKKWLMLLAVLIAFSRLYLYVHFPTDVLAGAAIGAAAGWLFSGCLLRGGSR